jgi:hypothetical protein
MSPQLERYIAPSGIPTMWGAPVTHFRVDHLGAHYAYLTLSNPRFGSYPHIGTMWVGEFICHNRIYYMS